MKEKLPILLSFRLQYVQSSQRYDISVFTSSQRQDTLVSSVQIFVLGLYFNSNLHSQGHKDPHHQILTTFSRNAGMRHTIYKQQKNGPFSLGKEEDSFRYFLRSISMPRCLPSSLSLSTLNKCQPCGKGSPSTRLLSYTR